MATSAAKQQSNEPVGKAQPERSADSHSWKHRFWQEIRTIGWIASILGVLWVFGYAFCFLDGANDFARFGGGVVGMGALVGILTFIVMKSHRDLLPQRFILLGVTLMIITVLVQSFSGEPICLGCGIPFFNTEAIKACRVRMIQTWFGNLGFIWGVVTAMFGVAWRLWDERKEEEEKRRQLEKSLDQIDTLTLKDPIQAARLWHQIYNHRVNRIQVALLSGLNDRRDRYAEKWTDALLMEIDWKLINGIALSQEEIKEDIKLLADINQKNEQQWERLLALNERYASSAEEQNKNEGENFGRKEISSQQLTVQEKEWNAIIWLWKAYDILAREWVAALIKGFLDRYPTSKKDVEENLKGTRNSRRLGRHLEIRGLFPNLAPAPYYNLASPWAGLRAPALAPSITEWLGDSANPFGMARAEWEKKIASVYYDLPQVKNLMEGEHMAWIWAPAGSGRTALARATYDRLIQKPQQFPLYLELNQPLPDPVPAHILDRLLAQLTSAWGAVLQKQDSPDSQEEDPFNGPVAFLDLARDEQRRAAYLFLWRFGSLKGVLFWLESLNIDWRHDKQGKALKARLAYFLKEAPDQKILEKEYRIPMAASRPVGLQATYVMIECHGEMPEHQARAFLRLAESLQAQNVYLKILAPAPPPEPCPEARLKWTEKSLHALLEKRDTDRMLDDGARKALVTFTCDPNNGSPRELMRLGNLALRLRAEREESGEYSPPPDAEGVLTKEDIEFAIKRWPASESTSENAC